MTVRDGNYQDRIIEDAPTFYWRLDNDYLDAMGNAEVGVAVNGVFGSPKYGVASATINGISGFINIAHHASMNFSTNVDFTIEFWYNKSVASGTKYILSHMSAFSVGWSIQHNASDKLYLKIAATTFTASTAAIPEDGHYHHIVIVVDRDTNVTYYIDNVAQVIATVPNDNTDATSVLTIGARADLQNSASFGLIDEVAIYRKRLTAADVDRHYKAGNKHYSGNVAMIDTVGFDIDISDKMFGLSDASIQIKRIYFYDPTAGDKAVLRDKSGNIVAELLCLTTNDDVKMNFEDETLRCQGLKMLAADNTQTTGQLIITFA